MDVNCKIASLNNIKLMFDWARAEGWNPGLHDHIPFHVTDPQGFFIAYIENTPVASLSAVRYPGDFAFVGFYIVKPEYRGRGIGLCLWEHGMHYLAGYNVGLDGVIAQQKNYQKSGFVLAHRNIRFSGAPPKAKSTSLVNIRELPFDLILNYDRTKFPTNRAQFLSAWLNVADNALAVIENNKLVGYGVIRKCREGFKIGPLFAEKAKIAEQIFLGLCHSINTDVIFLDIPEKNKEGMKLAEQFDLKPVFETARMYTQFAPNLDLSKIYGITSFELG